MWLSQPIYVNVPERFCCDPLKLELAALLPNIRMMGYDWAWHCLFSPLAKR
jgi:hypothetical protein